MGNSKEIINYKNAVEAAFLTEYPNYNVTVFRRIDDDFKTPAIVINPPKMSPALGGLNTSAGLLLNLKSSVFICFSGSDEQNELDCIQLSVDIAKFIHRNKWGIKTTPAQIVGDIDPTIIEGLEDLVIQRIDFEQNITIS